MSLEYKNRGILHMLTSRTKFRPQASSKPLFRIAAKAVLAAETTVLFAKDLAVNRLVGKETHIKFERRQGKNGRYRTHIKLVRAEAPQQLPRGILHKLNDIGRFFEGDKPFQKKEKIEYKPKTVKGKIAYYGIAKPLAEGTRFHLKYSAKAVKGAALASESALLTAKSAGINMLTRRLRMSSDVSDGGKAAMTALSSVSAGRRAVRYLKTYRKRRVKYKESKQSYKSQKLTGKAEKQKLKAIRKENRPALFKHRVKRIVIYGGNIQRLVKFHASHGKTASKGTYKRQRKVSAGKQLVLKSKIQYRKKLNSTEKAIYKNQKKFQKLAKKKMKRNKVTPAPLVPVIVPSAFALKRIGRKGWEKTLTADQNNDFLQAADKISRGASAVHSAAKPIKQKLYEKRTQTRQNKLQKERNRLTEKKTDLKKNKRKNIKKNQKTVKNRAAEKAKAAAKKAAQKTKKAVGDFAKFAIKLLGSFLAPIIGIIFIFAVVMMMFTGSSGNSSYILGTYNAQDRYLSWACEHYTKIAYDFNEKILKLKTDDWKNGLGELGVNTESYDSKPDKLYWGKSEKYSQKPHFDYDEDKLASFMCAYYYEPPDDEGNMKYWEWNNESEIDSVLQDLFDTEYSFKHSYEDFSGWKKYQQYAMYGGGGAESGRYYSVYKENFSKNRMKIRNVPNEIKAFCKDEYLHYDYDTLEVLDANNGDKRTGYFIQDQRYIITDPKGNSTKPFYSKQTVDRSEVEKYIYDGSIHYRTYGTKYAVLDNNSQETGYFVEDINSRPFKYYKFVWANGKNEDGSTKYLDRTGFSFTDEGIQIWCVVPSGDTVRWNDSIKDAYLISFYRKSYWYENCDLYYTVQSKCTFDEAIEKVLKKRENSTERIKFYHLLAEGGENTACPYGFHQSMNAPLGTKALQPLIDKGKIYNRFGYNIKEWNQKDCEGLSDSHNGVDILCKKGDKVYAMMNGNIEWVDKDKNSLSILGSWNYWYDDNSDRNTALKYFNIKTNLKAGDTVKAGQYIGTVTTKKHCYDNKDIKASKTYLHVEIAVLYGKKFLFADDWSNINPIYLMYRNDNEVA